MTKVQAQTADRFVRKPPPETRAILVYGPDAGLVSERAQAAVAAFTEGSDDPFAHVRIDQADLQADPARIADEAAAIALFGARRAVRVRPESHDISGTLKGLAGRIAEDVLVIVEAGNLAPASALRKLFENTDTFAAVPCYADSERDLSSLIDEALGARDVRIDADARAFLLSQLGGDRAASRMELEKLSLYAGPGGKVAFEDVAAIVGDVSALDLDQALDAAGLGDAASLDRALQRLMASGSGPAQLVAGAIRHFLAVHAMRADKDAGQTARAVVEGVKPPIFFKRRDAVVRQVERWRRDDIEQALDRLQEAERLTRSGDDIAGPAVAQTLLDICVAAPRE